MRYRNMKEKYIKLARHRGSTALTFHGAKRYLLDYHKTQWKYWQKDGFDCWADSNTPRPTRHDYYTATVKDKDLIAPSNWLLQQRDDSYTRRACVLAVLMKLAKRKCKP